MTINLDPNIASQLNAGMTTGEGIELPFPVVYSWALNGQAAFKSLGGAPYYGGWACKVENMQEVCTKLSVPVPTGWAEGSISTRDGGEFGAYTARNILVAPIGMRESWLLENMRSPSYQEGARRHLQLLAYMAERKGDKFQPWGAVVLTAKGFQGKNLRNALTEWDKVTSAARRKVAPGVPAWCFYLSVGTFGKDRAVEQVGRPGAQSPITPVSCYVPEKLDEALMESLFVGDTVAAIMADLAGQAQEWLGAWKSPAENKVPMGQIDPEYFSAGPDMPF